MLANVVVACAVGVVVRSTTPQVESALLSPRRGRASSSAPTSSATTAEFPPRSFAAQVWTNNAWVAALCIALGVLGLPVICLLLQNILNVALTGAS